MRIETDFKKQGGYWSITRDGVDVFKKPATGKMRAVKAIVSNATKGVEQFKLILEIAEGKDG